MIIIGYQGIGKSTLGGKCGCIDLESSSFYITGERDPNWYEVYCKIAESLSRQGYVVFVSSHKEVQDRLEKSKEYICAIYPDKPLKELWIDKLKARYEKDKSRKNLAAYRNAEQRFDYSIEQLSNYKRDKFVITEIGYSLVDIINMLKSKYGR